MQRQLHELAIGFLQRIGQYRGARLQARVEHRNDQRDRQDSKRHDDDQQCQPVGIHTVRSAAETALRKACRRHPRVMHARDRQAHDQRRGAAPDPYILQVGA